MKFIDKELTNFIRFLGILFLIFAIIVLIGYPAYCLIFSRNFKALLWVLGIFGSAIFSVLFGFVAELAYDKLELDKINRDSKDSIKE